MEEKRTDRRIQRTRRLLFDALTELMIEKGYEEITVQDLMDRADVGRSTFYAHFYDKDQLLIASIDRLRDFIEQHKPDLTTRNNLPINNDYHFGFSLAMLEHAQSHKRLYQAVTGKKSGAQVMGQMQRLIRDLAQDEILLFPREQLAVTQELALQFIVNTFSTVLTWWMEQGAQTPAEEIDLLFHRLTLSGLISR